MQPIEFQCGHCGKLMAVSSQHLGQQVRCPHCQQVVIAPPPAVPTVPSSEPGEEKTEISGVPPPQGGFAETVLHKTADAAEDIFAPPNGGSDLFGLAEPPRIEIPLETQLPTLPSDGAVPPQPLPGTLPSSLPWAAQQSAENVPAALTPFGQSENTANLGGAMPPWQSGAVTETLQPPAVSVPLLSKSEQSPAGSRSAKREEAKAPWFLLLVFCPLLLYSIVISIFAFFIYRHEQQLQEQFRERFDKTPDVGDDPGVRKGKRVSLTDRYKPELATMPLPKSLCTTLRKPLRVGDLLVTPNRVERKRVSVVVESSKPEPCKHDSLVLYLDLKNLSTEYAFAPLDNYFDRYWRPGMDMIPPLTLLEVGDYRCYGGPAHWYPRGDRANRREWVKGRRDQAEFLQPGEEKEMFVCTDGEDDTAAALLCSDQPGEGYHGRLLWRVRVRRGLVRFQGKDYSATAVIGVRFTDSDIRQAPTEVQ